MGRFYASEPGWFQRTVDFYLFNLFLLNDGDDEGHRGTLRHNQCSGCRITSSLFLYMWFSCQVSPFVIPLMIHRGLM